MSTERRRRTRKGFNWLAFHVFSRQGIEQKGRKRLDRKRKRNRRKVSMADQARSIEYRLKRYCGSLRSPMRENRTTVGQLSVFSLHFCSILPLSLLFFFSYFKEESLAPLCVPPLLARQERGNYTDFLSFVGETIAGEPCN